MAMRACADVVELVVLCRASRSPLFGLLGVPLSRTHPWCAVCPVFRPGVTLFGLVCGVVLWPPHALNQPGVWSSGGGGMSR